MTIQIRPIRSDEFDAYIRAGAAAFSEGISDEERVEFRSISEEGRDFAAFDGDVIVGGASAASLHMTVPGGRSVAVGAVPHVGVLPTHRRRGINTALFRAQLDDMRARGEPLSALHVSEAGIYSGFGYGMASFLGDLRVETARTAFVPDHRPRGPIRLVPREDALPLMRPVYDAAVRMRAGMMELNDTWLSWRFGGQAPEKPEMTHFFAIHETGSGVADGYAVYRVKHEWPADIPMNELTVRELMATSPEVAMDLWRYVFDIDLIRTVIAEHRPPDDPLLWLVAEPRRLHFTLSDGVWVRLIDVPAALTSRSYAEDGRVVLDVADAFCPWNDGRHALEVSGGEATCVRTDDPADLACRVNELASTYLGGASFAEVAQAGLVDERVEGGIARADALFRSEPAPWCSLPF